MDAKAVVKDWKVGVTGLETVVVTAAKVGAKLSWVVALDWSLVAKTSAGAYRGLVVACFRALIANSWIL